MRVIIEDSDCISQDECKTFAKDLVRVLGSTVNPLPLCAFICALEHPETHVMSISKAADNWNERTVV